MGAGCLSDPPPTITDAHQARYPAPRHHPGSQQEPPKLGGTVKATTRQLDAYISPEKVAADSAAPATPSAPATQASATVPVMMPALASTMPTCKSAAAAS